MNTPSTKQHLVLDIGLTTPYNVPVCTQSARNENVPMHSHSYIEFFYVFGGSGTHHINGQTQHLQHGDAFLLLPSDVHGFEQTKNGMFLRRDILIENNYFKLVCDFFAPHMYQNILDGKYPLRFVLSSEQIGCIETCVPGLFSNPSLESYALSAKSLTTYLLNVVLENEMKADTDYPHWLNNLLTRLSTCDNFQTDLSELTADFFYNPDYMRRLFKKLVGMTMTDYFNKQKMNYAYSLLQSGSATVAEVCEIVGIPNVAYFYRLFKDTFHETPNAARKRKS